MGQAPHEADRVGQQHRLAAGQGDVLVFQQVALRDAQAHDLGAGLGVEQARTHAQRDAARVGDAVVPCENVLGVDRREVEVGRTRVVVGQEALVAVRRPGEEGTRLQGLQEGPAEVAAVALEHQPAVQAEGGQGAVG